MAAVRKRWTQCWIFLCVSGIHLLVVGLVLSGGYVVQRYPSGADVSMRNQVGVQLGVPDWLLWWSVGLIFTGGLFTLAGWRMSGARRHGAPDVRWPSRRRLVLTAAIGLAISIPALLFSSQDRDSSNSSIVLATGTVMILLVLGWNIIRREPLSTHEVLGAPEAQVV